MDVSQSFRLKGETAIIKIQCDHVFGQYVVHWEDIERIFPGASYVKKGDIAVTFAKNPRKTK
jgi:hypothetical protein